MRGFLRTCALLLLPSLLPCGAFASGRGPDPPPGPAKGTNKSGSPERQQLAWDQGFDLPPGSHLRFEKVDQSNDPAGHAVRYRVFADAAQLSTPYVLGVWRIGNDLDNLEVLSESAYVNRKGLVLNNLPNPGQQDSVALTDGSELEISANVAKGEPVRVILRSQDWKTMIGGTIVPFPIESTSKNCRLRALLAEPEARAVLLYADGFPSNSILTVESNAPGAAGAKIYTDAKGHGSLIEEPRLNGQSAGTITETVRVPACAVTVNVPWGVGSSSPM
jgi:hypothetical protein